MTTTDPPYTTDADGHPVLDLTDSVWTCLGHYATEDYVLGWGSDGAYWVAEPHPALDSALAAAAGDYFWLTPTGPHVLLDPADPARVLGWLQAHTRVYSVTGDAPDTGIPPLPDGSVG